ncbi:restriction endonuclease subunit S [Pseudarthrobacter sp. J1738]|uniref:restriction endonuclease subunit S n=1 Tax=Pseudarthrobacter sp. J1738 TaxID=3420446 RepID=UPI003D2CAC7C
MTKTYRSVPLKHVVTYNDEVLPESYNSDSEISYIEISDVDSQRGITGATHVKFGDAPSRARRIVRENDVLVSTVRTYLRAIAPVEDHHDKFIASTGFCVLRPKQIHPAYLKFAVLSPDFVDRVIARSTGISYPAINASDLVRIPILVPTLSAQQRVANFLDRETAQIDNLIAKQERLIELLAEKRQAVTDSYVAETVEPLADDPGLRLKYTWRAVDDRANGADLPLMSVSIHHGVQRRSETTADEPRADDLSNYKLCRRGDIVINRMRAFQGALGVAREPGLVSPDYLVVRPGRYADADWLSRVLRSTWAVGQMQARLRGIGSIDQGVIRTPRINTTDLGGMRIRIPSLDSQSQFLAQIRSVDDQIERLVSRAGSAVAVLRERRSALISAAVTGKINVTEGA